MMKPVEDEVIHKILKGIADKWRAREATETPASGTGKEIDTMETVILSTAGTAAPGSPGRNGEEWTETVVLSARGAITEPFPRPSRDPFGFGILETVALAAGGTGTAASKTASPDNGRDFVPETVILSPGVWSEEAFGANGAGSAGGGQEEGADGVILSETVILTPRRTNVKVKRWKE
jgi:hypothetical protein